MNSKDTKKEDKKYLLRIPKKYENRFLSNKLEVNKINVFQAIVKSVHQNNNSLNVNMYLPLFKQSLKSIIFNAKSFHLSIFKIDEKYFILAKITEDIYGNLQIIQPKTIPIVDIIHTTYTRIAYKNYIRKNLGKKTMKSFNLPDKIIDILDKIHNPSLSFYEENLSSGKYENQALYAIKWIEMFLHLEIILKKKKEYASIKKLDSDIKSFTSSLPFELSKGQKNAILDIELDFKKDNSSKRVIMGDVGCGKTMVILASISLSLPNKSLVMAPTTILASQLFEEAKKYLKNAKIQLISTKTKEKLDEANNVFIGTHALLYRELPANIPLIIIDEQHKFGAKQRTELSSKLKQGKKRAHFLQFSATPIPRTMSMIDSCLVDFSFIRDTPFPRNIKSKLIYKNDFKNLLAHIKKEISKNNQIIIVYPLTNQSESINYKSLEESKEFWSKNFKGTYYTHGKDKEKEIIIEEFAKKGSILLSTTMVEVGISLSRVSTMVIVGAERFGLSTLHQLRGRVSRTGLEGYLFLYTNNLKNERLNEFIQTKSGFDIAELDLTYRNAGDLIQGNTQSGKEFKFIDLALDKDIIQEVKEYLEQ